MADVGSFRPQGTPYNGLYEEAPPPPQKGVPFLSKMVYKRVRGWILPGVAFLYIILLRPHQTLGEKAMHCSAYTKDQLPVIIVDLQVVNLIVASEKGLKLHLNFYSAILYLF